jgi:hypothetical protein
MIDLQFPGRLQSHGRSKLAFIVAVITSSCPERVSVARGLGDVAGHLVWRGMR